MITRPPIARDIGDDGAYFMRGEGDMVGGEAFVWTEHGWGVGLWTSVTRLGDPCNISRKRRGVRHCTYVDRVAVATVVSQQAKTDILYPEHLKDQHASPDIAVRGRLPAEPFPCNLI